MPRAERIRGTVKWFGPKGFGFLTADNSPDHFFHASRIGFSGWKPEKGEAVTFVSRQNTKGMYADDVQPDSTAMKETAA